MTLEVLPAGAAEQRCARQVVELLANAGPRALAEIDWQPSRALSLGTPLPWFVVSSARDLGRTRTELGTSRTLHFLALDGAPIGTVVVDSGIEGGLRELVIGESAANLADGVRRASNWAAANPPASSSPRYLFGTMEREFGVRMLIVACRDLVVFPLGPVPAELEALESASVEQLVAGIEQWRRRLRLG